MKKRINEIGALVYRFYSQPNQEDTYPIRIFWYPWYVSFTVLLAADRVTFDTYHLIRLDTYQIPWNTLKIRICMYLFVSLRINTYLYVSICILTYLYVSLCSYTYLYVSIRIFMVFKYVSLCIYAYLYVSIRIFM